MQMGSCRMGMDPHRSVVDVKGQSWQVEGLYITDTSLFPSAVGINPMVTAEAMAYVVAGNIAERLTGRRPSAEHMQRDSSEW